MDIGEKLIETLKIETIFTIKLGNLEIPVTETVVLSWIVMLVLISATILLRRNWTLIPKGAQALVEMFVEFLNNYAKEQFGKYARVFGPYVGTLFLYLITANIIPAFSPVAAFGFDPPFDFKPPARDINVPAALALVSILLVFFGGIIAQGPKGWAKSLLAPIPAMLPFNILEYIIKPVTLCLRLFGNILGGFIIMNLVNLAFVQATGFSAVLSLLPSLYFDFLDGFIQALVFTFLTTLYIAEAVEKHS